MFGKIRFIGLSYIALIAVAGFSNVARAAGPTTSGALIAQGDERWNAGDRKGALALYQQARKLDNSDPQLLLTIAVTAYNTQDFEAAREALDSYLKALPEKAKDARISELRAALDRGPATPSSRPTLTASQRLEISTVASMVEDLLAAQRDQNESEVQRLANAIRERFGEIQLTGTGDNLALWRSAGIFALATKDAVLAAWADETLLRLAGDNWDKDAQLAKLLPQLNALADAPISEALRQEHAFLTELQAKYLSDPDATLKICAALVNRGIANDKQENEAGAVYDYMQVVGMKDAPPAHVAPALVELGLIYVHSNLTRAVFAFTQAINIKNAPADLTAGALYNRGEAYSLQHDTASAISDYTQAIRLEGAPAEVVAWAMFRRGLARGVGDVDKAISDLTRVIAMRGKYPMWDDDLTPLGVPKAPPGLIAKALYSRGCIYRIQGKRAEAIADFTEAIKMTDAPQDVKTDAATARGELVNNR